jgi:hypothetical protein
VDDTAVNNDTDMIAGISLTLNEFSLLPPKRYSLSESQLVVSNVLNRLKESLGDEDTQEVLQEEKSLFKLRSLLLVRFITRGVGASEETDSKVASVVDSDGQPKALVPSLATTLRDKMCDFVLRDLTTRLILGLNSLMQKLRLKL